MTKRKTSFLRILCILAVFLLNLALVWKLFRYLNFPIYLLIPAAFLLFLLVMYLVTRYLAARNRKSSGEGSVPKVPGTACRAGIGCAILSCFLSAAFVVGRAIDSQKRIFSPTNFLSWFAIAAAFFLAFLWITDELLRHPPIRLKPKQLYSQPKQLWILFSIFFFLSWLPCLFLYYPGSVSPDSLACIVRAIGKARLSNQQPVLYTLMMRPFLLASLSTGGGLTSGVALFLAVQTAAMAVMLGYLPYWLAKKQYPVWTLVLTAIYFILNPVFPMYSSTMWKDIPFGGLILLYVLNVWDIVESRGEWLKSRTNLIWFVLLNFLISFMRNNGYYIIAVTLIVLMIVLRRDWKRLVPCFLAVLVAVPVIQGPVYDACGVEQSPFAESVAIPLQQIGYTVAHNGTLTPAQADFLNQLLPLEEMKKAYTPHSANNIKFHKDFNSGFLDTHKIEFLKVWAEMLGPNFKSYCRAYGMQTIGYWHPGIRNWVLYNGIGKGYGAEKLGLFMSDPLHAASNRAVISKTFSLLQNFLPTFSVVNTGCLFWLTVFAAFLLAVRRKGRFVIALLPLFVLWGTLMIATPVFCEFRYMFGFATSIPAVLLAAFPEKNPEIPVVPAD
mgnify:FL=1|jgi:hypothetical protein